MSRSSRRLAVLVAGAVVLAACTRPENSVSDIDGEPIEGPTTSTAAPPAIDSTDPAATTSTSDAPTTTAPASTSPPTSAATTTAPPAQTGTSTTVAPTSPADVELSFDGVLPHRFGDRDVDVVPALTSLLGDPTSDTTTEYPEAIDGEFYAADGETAFVAPFGRNVCYSNGLCVQFGAGAPETLIFTGWEVSERDVTAGAAAALATPDGISVGSVLAAHLDVITFDPAVSCFQVAYGSADGVDVVLLSDDGVFAAPNADGDGLVIGDPDPGLVTVQALSAGEMPVFVFADC